MTGYIRGMRERIGHATLLLCGAGVIVENAAGEVLLQRRADNGCWSYAGGCVEIGERVEDTARRELLEETGLVAGELTLFGVFSGPEQRYTYPNGDDVYNVSVVYTCSDFSGELRPDASEVTALRFFPVDSLPDPISPPDVSVLAQYARRKRANRGSGV